MKSHTKMSTKCHTKRGLFVDKSVHEMSPKVSTRCHLFCPRDVCHPIMFPVIMYLLHLEKHKVQKIKNHNILTEKQASYLKATAILPAKIYISMEIERKPKKCVAAVLLTQQDITLEKFSKHLIWIPWDLLLIVRENLIKRQQS